MCVLDVVGSSIDWPSVYGDLGLDTTTTNDIDNNDGGSSDDYEPPDLQAEVPTEPVYGTRAGELLQPEHVRAGRQKELDSIVRHHVIEVVPNGGKGKHIRGGWVEYYIDIRCRGGGLRRER